MYLERVVGEWLCPFVKIFNFIKCPSQHLQYFNILSTPGSGVTENKFS